MNQSGSDNVPHVIVSSECDSDCFDTTTETGEMHENELYNSNKIDENYLFYDDVEMRKLGLIDKKGRHGPLTVSERKCRKIGEKPKRDGWLQNFNFENKGIFDNPVNVDDHTPYDELAMKQNGLVTWQCRRPRENDFNRTPIVNAQRPRGCLDDSVESYEYDLKSPTSSETGISNELLVSFRERERERIKHENTVRILHEQTSMPCAYL